MGNKEDYWDMKEEKKRDRILIYHFYYNFKMKDFKLNNGLLRFLLWKKNNKAENGK